MTRFQHDCNVCESLGEFEGRDLYRCGDEGPQYSSSLISIARRDEPRGPIGEACKRFLATPAGATWLKREAVTTAIFYARDLSRDDWIEIKQELEAGRAVPAWVTSELKTAITDLIE